MLLDQKVLNQLNEIGIALSKESHIPTLLEKILISAKELTYADGGTIYSVTPDHKLRFEISLSTSLGFHMGGSSEVPVHFTDLPLILENGEPNDQLMVAYSVNHKKSIRVRDAYQEEGFDFSGTKLFDEKTGYRTRSVLTVPMFNHENDVIAVLQLINPTTEFSEEDQQLAESLGSQAGIALTNQLLISHLKGLFESLIQVVAEAIDEKSPSTAHHGKRMPIVTLLLAEAVSKSDQGPFKDVHYSKEELYELEVAAYLHDCGKITTPEYVVEKRHKLETIFDRIELVRVRYELLMEKKKNVGEEISRYREELALIERCNLGEQVMDEETLARLKQCALTPDELENLSIVKGNLTDKERAIIQNHVTMTHRMLLKLKYPKNLAQVPEIAASHHERMDGKGYPRGLTGDQMSMRARILPIADIFEALSAPDRPYKKALPLSQVFEIMQELVDQGHLDPDLYAIFIKQKVYLPYAREYLSAEQLDVL
ncbi:MAG: hypothetical protein S4CHLAM123_04090 [Chlamydiales bacterium]|nr:hypothetical protein [Chlamydiales bacterium]